MVIALRPVTVLLSVSKSRTRSFHSNVDVPRFAGKFPKMFISLICAPIKHLCCFTPISLTLKMKRNEERKIYRIESNRTEGK